MDTLATWRSHIEGVTAHEAQDLANGALEFLETEHSSQAVALGWNEIDLFGIYNGEVIFAARRRDALGLIPSLYLGASHTYRITTIEPALAVLETGGGSTLRLRRRPTAADLAVPFWEHQALQRKRR